MRLLRALLWTPGAGVAVQGTGLWLVLCGPGLQPFAN